MSTVSPLEFLPGLRFEYSPSRRRLGFYSGRPSPLVFRFPTMHLAKKAHRLGITATRDCESTPWEWIVPDTDKLFEAPDDREPHNRLVILRHAYLVQRAHNAITDILEECIAQLVHLGDDSEEWYWCRVSAALRPQFGSAALTGEEVREIVMVFVRGRVRYLVESKGRGRCGRMVCGEVAGAVDRWVSVLGGSVPMENSGLGELERDTTWLAVLQSTLAEQGAMTGVGGVPDGGLGSYEDFFAKASACLLGGGGEGVEGVTGLLVFSWPAEDAEDRRRYLGAVLALRRLRSNDLKIVRIQAVLFFPWDNYSRYLHPFWKDHADAITTWKKRLTLKVEQWAAASSTESRTVMLRNGFVGGKWDYRAYRGGMFVNTNNEPDGSDCWDDSKGGFENDNKDRYFGPGSISMCMSWMHALLTTMPPGMTVTKAQGQACGHEDDMEDDLLLPPGGSEEKIRKWMTSKGYEGVLEWGYRPDELSEHETEEVKEPATVSEGKSNEVDHVSWESPGRRYNLASGDRPSLSSSMSNDIPRQSLGLPSEELSRQLQRLRIMEGPANLGPLPRWDSILNEFHFNHENPERLPLEIMDEIWELDSN
ncbi:hypothetical protein QBC40DRAFT_255728 [Triangularia verruculosa]|uniref:Uncharacterized protein n=1 Tax=Triangularia verruculosa TaxID=2587418 RepID=A0AAN7AV98_9PEZI|nr:hypothetical protein QBC40DRAFT_255728 [Triangularia verruculosa]